jgi:hypothetical protein
LVYTFNLQAKKKPPAKKAAGKPRIIISAQAHPVSHQRVKLLEEFAALDQEVANFKPRLLRHEKLRSLILDWNPDLPPNEEETLTSKTCDIIITSRDRIRSVSLKGKQALFKLWGTQDFVATAVVHVKSLPDPEDKDGLYTVQAPTGPRHLKVIRREQAANRSAA